MRADSKGYHSVRINQFEEDSDSFLDINHASRSGMKAIRWSLIKTAIITVPARQSDTVHYKGRGLSGARHAHSSNYVYLPL
jgi:hypothetical protein